MILDYFQESYDKSNYEYFICILCSTKIKQLKKFLSPEPEVTWHTCTVATIIWVILLSPYSCICGIFLYSIYPINHAAYILTEDTNTFLKFEVKTWLESLRKGVRRLFNKSRRDKNPRSWELYREAQRVYRKEIRKGSKETWKAFLYLH